MAAEPENESVIIVETQKRARKGIDILTAFNAPNDYSNPETLQRFTSGLENEVFPNKALGTPSSTGFQMGQGLTVVLDRTRLPAN